MNVRVSKAAMTLVGVPFRLHGRDPASGLDCMGLVAEAMLRAGYKPVAPNGYSLRASSVESLLPFVSANGLKRVRKDGVIALVKVNPLQPHLLVRVQGGFVHAHAGIGRVTFLPGELPWPIHTQWRVTRPRTR
jgi:hypothetical protein